MIDKYLEYRGMTPTDNPDIEMLEYKGYQLQLGHIIDEDKTERWCGYVMPPGENQTEVDDDWDNLVAGDTIEEITEHFLCHIERKLFFELIDWNDPELQHSEYLDDYVLDGGRVIDKLCRGEMYTVKYKFKDTTCRYRFWMTDKGKWQVEVKSPDGKLRHPDIRKSRECQLAFLKGQRVCYGVLYSDMLHWFCGLLDLQSERGRHSIVNIC